MNMVLSSRKTSLLQAKFLSLTLFVAVIVVVSVVQGSKYPEDPWISAMTFTATLFHGHTACHVHQKWQ